MNYGSVCSGIEAATAAWRPLGWRALFLAEVEPFPCAVLGHMWPVFFGFQGGKGVATCIGIGFATYPLFCAIAVVVGVAAMLISRYVSMASMLGLIAFGIGVTIRYGIWPVGLWGLALAALVVWRHRGNIQRIRTGTESKIDQMIHKKQS